MICFDVELMVFDVSRPGTLTIGVYVYSIKATVKSGQTIMQSGNVTILR